MDKPRVAILGLGIMGSGMARQALSAGFPLTVYNRTAERAAGLVKEGAKLARSPREAAAGADVVISMVADDVASRGMWLGDSGALAGVSKGAVLVESSTLTVGWVRELAGLAQGKGCELLDAPVTGSKMHAHSGQLNFLVGGSAGALAKANPVLQVMSKTITHLGPTGSGAVLKLINNFVCGVQAASLAEGLAWLERAGLDVSKALPIMSEGAPGSPLFKTLAERMLKPDYTPNFMLRLMAKDLDYAMKEASAAGLTLQTGRGAFDLFSQAAQAGQGEKDMAAVVEPLRKK